MLGIHNNDVFLPQSEPIEEPCHSENGSDVCYEIKMPLAGASQDEILLEKLDDSANMLKDTFPNEEEEIIGRFLSSLQPDCPFDNDPSILSNQVENEALIDKFSFHSSMCGFADLDYGSSAGKCDGTLGKMKVVMHCMFDDSWFLESDGDNIYQGLIPC